MKVKVGVKMEGLKIEMRIVLIEADKLWEAYGKELCITETLGSVHSPGSLHPYGYAIDLRTRYFYKSHHEVIAVELRLKLGPNYNVIVHTTHIHVEYDAILR